MRFETALGIVLIAVAAIGFVVYLLGGTRDQERDTGVVRLPTGDGRALARQVRAARRAADQHLRDYERARR